MHTLRSKRFLTILGIVLLAVFFRIWAATRLPVDFDEPDYLQAGSGYAAALRAGSLDGVIDYAGNREHPALVKLAYGLELLGMGPEATWSEALYAARGLSALFGSLAVLLLALVDPLAGGLLAMHTLAVKYTSQAYLEALPLCAPLAAVLAFYRSKALRDRWFWLSALALGITAAGKFTYFPAVFPILYLAIFRDRLRWHALLLYGGVAATAFVLFNPTLWHDPLTRLADSLFFHMRYSQGANVARAAYPWYQPLVWISRPVPWHPGVFVYPGPDGLVFWAAILGLVREARRRPWLAAWIVGGIVALLLWPTKWPQYTLALVPPLCLAAAPTLRWIYERLRAWEAYWHVLSELAPRPAKSVWIFLGVMLLALMVAMLANSFRTALGQVGWAHFTTVTSPLPTNTITALLPGPQGQMAIGTTEGLVLWSPPAATDLPDRWTVFTVADSGLPDDHVLALARDRQDALWVGTASGLARYDGSGWQVYRESDLGLADDRINALALGGDGRLWIGSGSGLAVFDGQSVARFTRAGSGLVNDYVLSLAVETRSGGDVIWVGTLDGVSRFEPAAGAASAAASFTSEDSGLGVGGVACLAVDSAGRVWAATLGGGLSLWDGAAWHSFLTSNSDIPNDTVQEVYESEPGILWVGTALPMDVGGTVSRWDGTAWRAFTSSNSGYSGAEPLAIVRDGNGRLWIGTQTAGVDLLRLER